MINSVVQIATIVVGFLGIVFTLLFWSNAELSLTVARVNALKAKGRLHIVDKPKVGRGYTVVKRIFDLVFSSFALICLAPWLAVICIAIKIESPGPVFYKRRRVGVKGMHFEAYKFRTMRAVGSSEDPAFPRLSDFRVTNLGRFLRRTSLDELPAFVNVLAGHMSLVGRSPVLDNAESARLVTQEEREALLSIKPGVISLWALSRDIVDFNFENVLDYDRYYLARMSFAFDLKAIIGAVVVLLGSTSQY